MTVHEDEWRKECDRTRRVSTSKDRKSRTTAFRRAYGQLRDKGSVLADGDMVWLPGFDDPSACFDDVEDL